MSVSGEVLLVGSLQFIQAEWQALANEPGVTGLKEYSEGSRADFFAKLDSGVFEKVVAIYRLSESTSVTGRFDDELIAHLPSSVRFICNKGAGYDTIDIDPCTKRGIRVANTPGAVDDATADTGIFIMLGALRLANVSMNILRQGQWGKTPLPVAHDPQGKTLGILGMGGIGRNLAAKARAFGMKIQYHNRSRLAPELEDGATYVDFKTLLATSDVFSLNLALNKSTEHIIGRAELAQMKKGVTIINTARGKLIDETALVEALEDGDRIWSVGLDVFEDEPAVHPGLLKNERAFLVPHIGTLTYETRRAMELVVLDNIKNGLSKGRLLTPVAEQKNLP